jgi:hypothetical protein
MFGLMGSATYLAFMCGLEIEHRKEWLMVLTVSPMGFIARFIPNFARFDNVVIFF